MKQNNQQITELLLAWNAGDEKSLEQILPVVETELRKIAHNYMRREKANHTLQTTALVNEAYLKLIDQTRAGWQNRAHFFAISAQVMRRILLNHARDQMADKRGGRAEHIELEEAVVFTKDKSAELIALDEALERLAEFDPAKSRVVEMLYFGGLTLKEASEVLGIARSTVSEHWKIAKAWLGKEIRCQNSCQ